MKFSIITSVGIDYLRFLPAAASSVQCLELSPGIECEWLVWIDGNVEGVVPLKPDSGVVFASGHKNEQTVLPRELRIVAELNRLVPVTIGMSIAKSGTFANRNHALAMSSGDVIVNLDADDQLMPQSLEAARNEFVNHPEAKWFAGTTVDVDENGDDISNRPRLNLPAGFALPGVVADAWEQLGSPPIHPGAFMAASDLVIALGGWGAISAAGDTMLMLALTSIAPGVVANTPVLRYRHWNGQFSQLAAKGATAVERHALMRRRVEALRKMDSDATGASGLVNG